MVLPGGAPSICCRSHTSSQCTRFTNRWSVQDGAHPAKGNPGGTTLPTKDVFLLQARLRHVLVVYLFGGDLAGHSLAHPAVVWVHAVNC